MLLCMHYSLTCAKELIGKSSLYQHYFVAVSLSFELAKNVFFVDRSNIFDIILLFVKVWEL